MLILSETRTQETRDPVELTSGSELRKKLDPGPNLKKNLINSRYNKAWQDFMYMQYNFIPWILKKE